MRLLYVPIVYGLLPYRPRAKLMRAVYALHCRVSRNMRES